ncbi:MAG TPA: RNA-binding protein [Opitutae bacterium]|nr:RNA-binding protein [Opitutaceae bacterium]HCR31054.1 RNA-binding protein [Opitutae bacterium]
MDIYVGNLSFDASEDDVRNAFSQFGNVESIKLITDRETGRPRGFGFVTMPDSSEANAAIESLNGTELLGRELRVREATPRPERPRQGGGGYQGGGGGFRGGGGGGGGYRGGGGGGKGSRRGNRRQQQDGF